MRNAHEDSNDGAKMRTLRLHGQPPTPSAMPCQVASGISLLAANKKMSGGCNPPPNNIPSPVSSWSESLIRWIEYAAHGLLTRYRKKISQAFVRRLFTFLTYGPYLSIFRALHRSQRGRHLRRNSLHNPMFFKSPWRARKILQQRTCAPRAEGIR